MTKTLNNILNAPKLGQLFFSVAFISLGGLWSCGDDWLEVKRDISLVVPETVDDMRALLNHSMFGNDFIALGDASSDDYYLKDARYATLNPYLRNAYIWQNDPLYEGLSTIKEWDGSYEQIFQANVALEGLARIHPNVNEVDAWRILKGEGHFYRGRAFFNLAQLFAPIYREEGSHTLMGIPLKMSADVSETITRASLFETYQQILQDLHMAAEYMAEAPMVPRGPSKPAAFAALARCYLTMGNYEMAAKYADSCLQLRNSVVDLNGLNASLSYPIPSENNEVIFRSALAPLSSLVSRTTAYTPEDFLAQYDNNDLRTKFYFGENADSTHGFRGSFLGSVQLFSGTTVGEMLLTSAECHARKGNIDAAMDDLNQLLAKRYNKHHFAAIEVSDPEAALRIVLLERRKELIRRGIRWMDLRRLSFDENTRVSLRRNVEGGIYTLNEGDANYIFPIPEYVIKFNGIPQNKY